MLRMTLICSFILAACHSHDPEGYATYQACYDDHHNNESLPVKEAIIVCCLDHPIAGVAPVCGNSANDCIAYIGTNLSSSSATPTEVQAACNDYITMKGQ